MSWNVNRSEEEVGILRTILIPDFKQKLSGLFKTRYSDFHVNEINEQGEIVRLTSFDIPERDIELELTQNQELDVELIQPWVEQIEDKIAQFQNMKESGLEGGDADIDITGVDKSLRKIIHQYFQRHPQFEHQTVDVEGKKMLRISRCTNASGVQPRSQHPIRRGRKRQYCHAVLYKEGIDMSEAINYLSKRLRIHSKQITYAGTKDKQGKTVQQICFGFGDAIKIQGLNASSKHSKLGNFVYKDKPLYLGALKGNHFKILIRDLTIAEPGKLALEDIVKYRIESLTQHGFINYFGLQRFGTFKVPTYLVGQAILQMDWLRVFDLILNPTDQDSPSMKKAKQAWLEHRDTVGACKHLTHNDHSIPTQLLKGLSQHYPKNNFLGAFKTLPRNIRTLYLHSYQSYIWNFLASARIDEFGANPTIGDLVYDIENADIMDGMDNLDEAMESTDPQAKPSLELRKPNVKLLTEADISKYTIFDVIIPVEGSEVRIPEGSNLNSLATRPKQNFGALSGFTNFRPKQELPVGTYRKLIVQPKSVSHKLFTYTDGVDLDHIIQSDYDLMENFHHQLEIDKEDTKPPQEASDTAILLPSQSESLVKIKDGLVIEFSLPASSYATMALREIFEEALAENREAGKTKKRDYTEIDLNGSMKNENQERKRICQDQEVESEGINVGS